MAAAMEASSSSSASVPTTEAKKIILKSSDNVEFEVEEAVALQSQTIKHMIENGCADNVILLPNITGEILDLVIEYCKKHMTSADELQKWDAEFVKIDQDALFDLIFAAKYLNMEGLVGLTCQTVADLMKGKTLMHSNQNSKPSKKIMLKSSDDAEFEVEEAVAVQSQTIKHMIEDGCADSVIPLPNITGEILDLVIEYCEKHVKDKSKNSSDTYTPSYETSADDELKKWDAEFVKLDQDALFDLILAANYLNIEGLLNLTTQTVADMMKGKTPEEIRKTFNIINDYTPEEEAELRSSMPWVFE